MSAHVLQFLAAHEMERAAGQGFADLVCAHVEGNMSARKDEARIDIARNVARVNQIEKEQRRAEMAASMEQMYTCKLCARNTKDTKCTKSRRGETRKVRKVRRCEKWWELRR